MVRQWCLGTSFYFYFDPFPVYFPKEYQSVICTSRRLYPQYFSHLWIPTTPKQGVGFSKQVQLTRAWALWCLGRLISFIMDGRAMMGKKKKENTFSTCIRCRANSFPTKTPATLSGGLGHHVGYVVNLSLLFITGHNHHTRMLLWLEFLLW